MKKKITIIVNEVSTLLHFRKDLILDLVSLGYEVFCLAEGYTNDTEDIIRKWGAIPITHNLKRSNLNPFIDIIEIIKIRKILKAIAPDIVLTCFVKPVIFASLAAKLAGVKKRVGMLEGLGYAFTHSPQDKGLKYKLVKFFQVQLYRIALPTLDKVLFLNPDDKKDLIDKYSIYIKSSDILGGIGVNLDEYFYVEQSIKKGISFVFLGRLLREKGIFEFLEAAKKVKEIYPQTKFFVLGQIDDQNPSSISIDNLQEYIDKNIIIYPGYIKNISQFIKDINVFVLPSYREGVPKSTQEAMAMGKVIITTDVPGCRETVVDGVNGFIVPPFSSTALVEKMIYLIENNHLLHKMGYKSREIAESNYDVKKVNQRLIRILEE